MSEPKPYTVAEVLDDDVVFDWDRTLATVRALEAATAALNDALEQLRQEEHSRTDAERRGEKRVRDAEAATAELVAWHERFTAVLDESLRTSDASALITMRHAQPMPRAGERGKGWASPEQVRQVAEEWAEEANVFEHWPRSDALTALDAIIARVLGGGR